MSATYDSTLPDDRNFVRFLINDTATSTAIFQDEEIDAVLVEEAITVTVAAALKYFGAARLLDRLHAQLGAGGIKHGGAMSKRVDDLARSFGISASTSAALDEKARELRRRGARLLNTRRSHFFRAMGGAVIVLCVSASSLAAQTIYSWLPFLPPVANAAALPTCANNTLTEWRMITALSPAPGSLYICPDGGGSWSCLVGADCPSTGSVTSVAITMPAEFSVSGSPIVGAGTLAITEATQSANRLYAGPSSGAAAAPDFRAIVGADLGSGSPSSANYLRGDMSWVAISSDPTLVGDVDGLSSANDLDEAAVETELEAVLDLQDQQGAVTDNQVPNNITVDLAISATSAADVSCTNCLGGAEIDESSLVLPAGDFVGPSSSTDNAVVRFDSTTGKLGQNSSVFVSDAALLGLGSLTSSHAGVKTGQDKNGSLAVRAVRADDGLTLSLVGYSLQLGTGDPSANTDHTAFYDAPRSEFTLGSGVLFGWSSGATNVLANADVNLQRHSAGNLLLSIGRTTDGLATLRLGEYRLTPQASPPVTCGDADTLGVEYVDTSLARCFCDGTSWQILNPLTIGVGACS